MRTECRVIFSFKYSVYVKINNNTDVKSHPPPPYHSFKISVGMYVALLMYKHANKPYYRLEPFYYEKNLTINLTPLESDKNDLQNFSIVHINVSIT